MTRSTGCDLSVPTDLMESPSMTTDPSGMISCPVPDQPTTMPPSIRMLMGTSFSCVFTCSPAATLSQLSFRGETEESLLHMRLKTRESPRYPRDDRCGPFAHCDTAGLEEARGEANAFIAARRNYNAGVSSS